MTPAPLRLPRSAVLTELLTAPAVGRLVDPSALKALRDRVVNEVLQLAKQLPQGQRLVIDPYRASSGAAQGGVQGGSGDRFELSPVTCRRAIGLAAVALSIRKKAAPAASVADVIERAVTCARAHAGSPGTVPSTGPVRLEWWAEWCAGLSPGALAVVQAEATTWATRLYGAVDWASLHPPAQVGAPADWWDCPADRRVCFKSKPDVRVRSLGALDSPSPVDLPGTGPHLGQPVHLVISGGNPSSSWRDPLSFSALASALARGAKGTPTRVVGLWPDGGETRVLDVDVTALEHGARLALAVLNSEVTRCRK